MEQNLQRILLTFSEKNPWKNEIRPSRDILPQRERIISNGNFKDAKIVGLAVKCCGNYIFKLYVWE